MFMWHRHSPWLNITVLCWGDEHECDKWLTESPAARHAYKQGRRSLFSNVTAILPSSCFVRDHPRALSVSGVQCRDAIHGQKLGISQDRSIIPAYTTVRTVAASKSTAAQR